MAKGQEVGGQTVYQIRVRGRLDERWSDWFGGLTIAIESENPPVTTLVGPVDQAAMRGILNRIWDLGLTLTSVVPKDAATNGEQNAGPSCPPGQVRKETGNVI
jgi:hypothetical protein